MALSHSGSTTGLTIFGSGGAAWALAAGVGFFLGVSFFDTRAAGGVFTSVLPLGSLVLGSALPAVALAAVLGRLAEAAPAPVFLSAPLAPAVFLADVLCGVAIIFLLQPSCRSVHRVPAGQ